jgi:sirohydrochlorin ferrochelatase
MLLGLIIVDHGSRVAQSNALLEEVARLFGQRFAGRFPIVEAAHMELAEPSIATAFARCVGRGAGRVIVCPFFLGPGKHWTHDLPRLAAGAAAQQGGVPWHVSPPLGIDDLVLDLLAKRVDGCIASAFVCDLCGQRDACAARAANAPR